jgi:hypothetical protein
MSVIKQPDSNEKTWTVTYRLNIGRYEPFRETLTGCNKVRADGDWLVGSRNGKVFRIPHENVIIVWEE